MGLEIWFGSRGGSLVWFGYVVYGSEDFIFLWCLVFGLYMEIVMLVMVFECELLVLVYLYFFVY